MPSLITNPTRHPTSIHRARIVADAVVSAYINEIAPSERAAERERARSRERRACTETSAGTITRPGPTVHRRRRLWAPRQPRTLEAGI